MKGYKTFQDTVHGYISVPNEYCDHFIDTENFQRLRRIEQLSSRSLYPCARHDRFVHSIGVYHIGRKMLDAIEIDDIPLSEELKQSFLIACLLHDVGHSPFSHTLESCFGTVSELFEVYKAKLEEERIEDKELANLDVGKTDVKQHEILSAMLCITTYHHAIEKLQGNPALVGRMIMGFPYESQEKTLENCFISLLHGDVIDADKLDYICRDKWSSGYQNNSVDVERIIRSVKLYKSDDGTYRIVYLKNALYDIQSMIDNKNFQANWIFKHHQVIYEQKIFQDAVEELVKSLGIKKEALFNYESYRDKVEVCPGLSVYMLSDDDIVHLMKVHKEQIPHFKEWFSRTYKYVPIWKTYSEFKAFMGDEVSEYILRNEGRVYDEIVKYLDEHYQVRAFSLECTPSMKSIKPGQVHLLYGSNKIMDFTTLGMPQADTTYIGQTFKYVFVEKRLFDSKGVITREALTSEIAKNIRKRHLNSEVKKLEMLLMSFIRKLFGKSSN